MTWPEHERFIRQAQYVMNASERCTHQGCAALAAAEAMDQARKLHQQAEHILEQARSLAGHSETGETVSQALWCDAGEHAFSARDPKRENWQRTMRNEEGEEVTVPWDVCGECLQGAGSPGFGLKERHEIMSGQDPRTK